jgi:GT2 family glycosyltransferase
MSQMEMTVEIDKSSSLREAMGQDFSIYSQEVTVAVLNYNGLSCLKGCLESVRSLRQAPGEIILVDDGSEDGSPDWVRAHYPEVRIVKIGANTKRLNKVRNRAIQEARTRFVFLVDNDVVLHPDCLAELLKGMERLPQAAVCMPRTLYENDHQRIYQDGQTLHYVGTTEARNRNKPLAATDDQPRLSIGWGVQLIEAKKAAEVGNFNEDYGMGWGDDGEFNYKMNLSGRMCYHVPAAVVYHKRVKGAKRFIGTVKNRWRFILECYETKTIVLCAPALVFYDLCQFLFVLKKGYVVPYFRALGETLRMLPAILSVRGQIQARRQVRDRQLMASGRIFIASEYVDSKLLSFGFGVMNGFLSGYWKLIRRVL